MKEANREPPGDIILQETKSKRNVTQADQVPDIRFLEQLDLSTIMTENVDIPNSQASISIPLVDVPISKSLYISMSLTYNSGEVKTNSLVGNGWSLQLPDNYIIVDQKESVFPSEFEYYLIVNSQMEKLERKPSNDGLQHFQLLKEEGIHIKYNPGAEQWIIDSKNLITVYGKSLDSTTEAVQRTLFWDSWRGPGRGDRSKLKSQVQAWYVISREEKYSQKRKLLYEYHTENALLSNGMSYTSVIQLKSVRDGENSTRVDLIYGTKLRGEYAKQNPENNDGFLKFPVFLETKLYLEGYQVVTELFRQELSFEYEIHEEKVRKLVGITQKFSTLGLTEELFRFDYDSETHLLTEVQRGTDKKIRYSYSMLEIPTLNFGYENNQVSHYTTQGTQISISSDFAVMAYHLNTNTVYLSVFNKQLTSLITRLEATDGTAADPTKYVEDFALITFPNLIAIVAETNSSRVVNTFNRNVETNEWSETAKKSTFKKGDLFRYSDQIMVVARNDTEQIVIFEPDEDDHETGVKVSSVTVSGGPIQRMVIQDKVILIYNGNSLFTYTRDDVQDTAWQRNPNLLNVRSNETELSKDVHMDSEFSKFLTDQMNISGLQMFKNMVLFSVLKWLDEKLSCKVNLFLLNNKYEVDSSSSQEFFTGDEKIETPIRSIVKAIDSEEENGTNTLKFRYETVSGGRWQAKLFDISGLIDEQLDEACKENDCPVGYKAEYKRNQTIIFNYNNTESLQNMVLFDAGPFIQFQLDAQGAKTNSTLLRMEGASWSQVDKDDGYGDRDPISNMTLANTFVLESKQGKNATSYRLFKQDLENGSKVGSPIKEFRTSNNGSCAVGYPSYVAYQEEPWLEAVILPLRDGSTIGPQILLQKGEVLLSMSNAEVILTMRELDDPSLNPFTHEVISRRVNTVVPSVPTSVLVRSEVQDGNSLRVRTYQNLFVSNRENLTQENTIQVIPTGNPEYSGWYEETTIIPVDAPSNATKTTSWIDSEGNLVRSRLVEFSEEDEEDESKKSDYKLFDVSRDLQISDTFPYNITNEMVAYIGFESYETPIVSRLNTGWSFPPESILRTGDSLTGESLLRLEEGQKVTTSLTPTDQFSTYVASCWVRLSEQEVFEFESPVSYFKAILKFSEENSLLGMFGQMKRVVGDWLYLEVTADLHKIRSEIYAEYYQMNQAQQEAVSLPSPSNVNFTIVVEIDSALHPKRVVEIDHLRFIPIESDLRMKIFDDKNGNEIATILPNGAVIRKVYNLLGQEIANVDEDGQIEQIISTSQSGQIFPVPLSQGKSFNGYGGKSDLVLKPEWSSYEKFNRYSFSSEKWTTDNESAWKSSNWQISHVNLNETNELKAFKIGELFDPISSAVRFFVSLDSINESKIQINIDEGKLLEFKTDVGNPFTASISIPLISKTFTNLPIRCELILSIENSIFWLFVDGNLLLEENLGLSSTSPWSSFSMDLSGLVTISDFMILNRPQMFQEYFNGFGDRTQVIQVESPDSILVSETIYDEIGREAITTKAGRITRNSGSSTPLFTFHSDFATNKYPQDSNSVFHTGILEGVVSTLFPEDEGYCYSRKVFLKDLLQESEFDGRAGREFSVGSPFLKKHARESRIPFLRVLFPLQNDFIEKVTHEPNGSITVSIINKQEKEIAQYVRVPGFDHILTTFEYDKEGNLLKILPPTYHAQVDTFSRTTPLPTGTEGLTENEIYWQKMLCTHYSYNEQNFLTKKMSPDTGIQGFSYDILGNTRFMYSLDEETGIAKNIVYLLHAAKNQPVEVGYLSGEMGVNDLLKYENSTAIPGQVLHQRVVYSDLHSDPNIRGKAKLFMTYSTNLELGLAPSEHVPPPHQEMLKFDNGNKVVLKTSNAAHTDLLTNLHKYYKGDKVSEIRYPRENSNSTSLNLIHSHNKLNHLVGLGTRQSPNLFSKFGYSTSGQIKEEIVEQGSSFEFTRNFHYNSPDLLVRISDPFLSQNITFIEDGYGQNGFGDGIIMKTSFQASWPESRVDPISFQKWFRLPEEDFEEDKTRKMCISALKRVGFVDEITSIPLKFLNHADLSSLPLGCTGALGHELMKVMSAKLPPGSGYGHRYAYGTHQELQKAKFFSKSEENVEPLQIYTFSKEIPEVESEEVSEQIWDTLKEEDFIIIDNRRIEDKTTAIGKEGTVPIFCYNQLDSDLEEINPLAFVYTRPIINLLYEIIIKNEPMVDIETFKETYVVWLGYRDMSTPTLIINRAKADAAKIYEMLNAKGYLTGEISSILSQNFIQKMSNFSGILPQIVQVLRSHFINQIGLSVNDYEAYNIDANGNAKIFYVGFERHTLEYVNGTNHVSKLSIQDPYGLPEDVKVFELSHDSRGNVNKAPHRNISEIRYHPVTTRPVFIQLLDGRKLIFQYDAQGERVLKRVYDAKEVLLSEVKYLRDERGNVLMDIRTKFPINSQELPEITTTTYLHGPRGLLGFIRNGKFYSVFTDHAGSIRLVTQGGLVVAGYDYWPYGDLMKSYGNEDAHIHYRFTGQEWDEETGLYNFHARIYDPTMGRFFQPDPKAQYYSPYIYGGNSPISLVDPDGEFFFTFFVIVGILVGAYLGGAAANGNWNPAKWDWKSLNTYMAIIGGGIAGGMMPSGFVTMVGSIGIPGAILVGLGGSYLSMGIKNKNWVPWKWDWTSPVTYNALFSGFGDGVSGGGLFGGFKQLKSIYKFSKTLGSVGQIIFLSGSYGLGLTLAYVNGALANGKNFNFMEWDFKNPKTFAAIKSGFFIGAGLPTKIGPMFKSFARFQKDFKGMSDMLKNMKSSTKEFFKGVLTDKNHPLYVSIGLGLRNYLSIVITQCVYDHCSVNPAQWDWQSMTTYEGIINGLLISPKAYELEKLRIRTDKKLGGNLWYGRMSSQKILYTTSGFFNALSQSMNRVSQFYTPLFPGGSGKQGGNSMLAPIAIQMLMSLIDWEGNGSELLEDFDDDDYQVELQNLLKGLSSGSRIHPDSNLGEFLDCSKKNMTSKGFLNNVEFEECDLGFGTGKTGRQNGELIHKLFVKTKKYQSNNEFSLVEPSIDGPQEFLDGFLNTVLGTSSQTQDFFYSYFIGGTYNSLLNYLRDQIPSQGRIFIRSENLAGLEKQVVHIVFLRNSVLSVRVVVLGSEGDFSGLAEHIKGQKYRCQVDSATAAQISKIETQVYLIKLPTGSDGSIPKVFTMTPESSLDMGQCSGMPQLVPIQSVDGSQNILPDFEQFLEKSKGNSEEKVEKFETFYNDVLKVYENIVANLGNESAPSFLGFLYGLLECNMENTYGLLFTTSALNNVAFVATKDGKGQEIYHRVPMILSVEGNQQEIESFLYEFSSSTLAKDALLVDLSNPSGPISSMEIPQFEGFFKNAFNNGGLQNLENSLKYLFYNDEQRVKDSTPNGNLHHVSNFILGEFLAQANMVEENFLRISVFSPPSSSQYFSRLGAQRLFVVRDIETGNCTVLNIIESSQGSTPIYDPTVPSNIPVLPNVSEGEAGISNIRHLKIKLNTKSVGSFSGSSAAFFQGFEETVEVPSSIPVDSTSYLLLESVPGRFIKNLSFDKNSVQNLFSILAENRLKVLVGSEIDFQALVSGLIAGTALLAKQDVDGMQVSLLRSGSNEKSKSIEEHSIVTLTKDNLVTPDGDRKLLQSLQFATGGETDVEAKFNEGTQSLEEHVCSNQQRYSEFWRVATVPAVFGPEVTNAIKFEVNPNSVITENCTNNMTFRSWYGNQRNSFQQSFAKSSASKVSMGIPSVNIHKFISRGINRVSQYFFGGSRIPRQQWNSGKDHNEREKTRSNDNVSKCQAGAWVDDSYSMSGITCLTEKSKVAVFRNIQENDLMFLEAGGSMLSSDSYDKSSCAPVEFNGMPSVTCKGQKTNLVYTPYLQERIFDNVDGNIMLGRMIIHLGGNLMWNSKSGNEFSGFQSEFETHVTVSDDMIEVLRRKLRKIKALLNHAAFLGIREVDWAQRQLVDVKESIDELEKAQNGMVSKFTYKRVEETLIALQEDLQENIDVVLAARESRQNRGNKYDETTGKQRSNENSEEGVWEQWQENLFRNIGSNGFSRENAFNIGQSRTTGIL
ncbi:unnamed protein product [Orchesella dallaii]|uniref:Tox-SGS domain-containing protein n=1 Tax=Orchesella dallaii TaxID=48710 RepID=A0ABP1PU46_9HEXA